MSRLDKLPPHQIPDKKYAIPYPNTGALLREIALEYPRKTVLIFPGRTTEEFTAENLEECYLKTASFLNSLRLKKGDRISIVFPNSPEFVFFYFAGLTLGITVVPINPELSSGEMRYIITDSRSKFIFIAADLAEKTEKLKPLLAP
nr:acyl--CoA ligase [FCB group bacterium]